MGPRAFARGGRALRTIAGFELFATDLPFRVRFKHSAAERTSSESLFLRCRLDDGTVGWGESLPRAYVTGESRAAAFELLAAKILPALVGRGFDSLAAVEAFLEGCDGRAPAVSRREHSVKAIRLRVRRLMGVDSFPDTLAIYMVQARCPRNAPESSQQGMTTRIPCAL